MSFCINCGFKLGETDIFCSNCGCKVDSILPDNDSDEDSDDELDEIVVLDDDNGNPVRFKFLDLLEYKKRRFAILLPIDDGYNSDEVVILEVITDALGNETFINHDNMKLLSEVYEEFKKQNEYRYNFI